MLPLKHLSKLFYSCPPPCKRNLAPVSRWSHSAAPAFPPKIALALWLRGPEPWNELKVLNRLGTVARWHQEKPKTNPMLLLREIWAREKTRSRDLQWFRLSFAIIVQHRSCSHSLPPARGFCGLSPYPPVFSLGSFTTFPDFPY